MNIQEVIKKYNSECFATIATDEVLEDLKQLSEQYKPVEVKQFVADWYEDHKDDLDYSIWNVLTSKAILTRKEKAINDWIENNKDAIITIVKMHLFGYTIKEEKKYLVRMIGLEKDESHLKYNIKHKFWYLGTSEEYRNTRVKHTIEELENSGFKEVFPSPLFEIIEVK